MVYKKFTPSQLANGPWDFSGRELAIEVMSGTVNITYFSHSKQREVEVESNDLARLPNKRPKDFKWLIASLHDLLPDRRVYNDYVRTWGNRDYDLIAEAIAKIYYAAFPDAGSNAGTRLPPFSFTPTDLSIDPHIPRGDYAQRDPTRYETEMFPLFLGIKGKDPDDTQEIIALERKLVLTTNVDDLLTATISYSLDQEERFEFSMRSIPNDKRTLEERLSHYFDFYEEELANGMIKITD